jgi:hypothetical protein
LTLVEWLAASRLSMMRIMARRKKAVAFAVWRSKADVFDALVLAVMRDEEELAAAYLDTAGRAADRLMAMVMDLHQRKRDRFVGYREFHDLYRRIVVERPDIITGYAERMTLLIGKLIA